MKTAFAMALGMAGITMSLILASVSWGGSASSRNTSNSPSGLASLEINNKEMARKISLEKKISSKYVEDVLDEFFQITVDTLQQNRKVKILGFGTFYASQMEGKTWIHPATHKEISIPSRKTVRFRPSEKLKKNLNLEENPKEEMEDDEEEKY